MQQNNFQFKKSLGQNFLHDSNIIQKIVNSADIDKNTLVIEIGPGSGAITKEIVPLCGHALLYEADYRLENSLYNLLREYDNYCLYMGDFLKIDISKDIDKYHNYNIYVVANLPYYITTPIIMKFIDENVFPDKFIIMVQKEVALRLSAKVGSKDYGALTVFLNYFYNIDKLFDVSRNCFVPKPNVDSSIVCMNLKNDRLFVSDFDLFKKVVRDSFSMKRKTIRNNLKNYNLDVIQDVLYKYNYDLSVRAEQLELSVFVDISNALSKLEEY